VRYLSFTRRAYNGWRLIPFVLRLCGRPELEYGQATRFVAAPSLDARAMPMVRGRADSHHIY